MVRPSRMKNRMLPTYDWLIGRIMPINMLLHEGALAYESLYYKVPAPETLHTSLWKRIIDMFLSPDEIIELTGRHRRDAQVTQLNKMGIIYKVRADGAVVVLTAHVNKEFGGNVASAKKFDHTEPNWGAVR
jgi:hypothetical protein